MTWEITAVFKVGEYKSGEVNLTPALGVSLILVVFFMLLKVEGL